MPYQLSDMMTSINSLVDDVIAQNMAIDWLNEGKNEMAQQANATWPDIDGTTVLSYPFSNTKWGKLPVIFAAARFLQNEVMLDQAQVYMNDFNEKLAYFVEKYQVDPQYWDNPNCQQFTATAGQLAFVVTKNSYEPKSANLRVYVNNEESFDWQRVYSPGLNPAAIVTTTTITNDPRGFVFNPTTTINNNDLITAAWEVHSDYMQAPYGWAW